MATTNGTSKDGIPPKITLYTNHGCPWAHRAHITLKELDLPYEEVIIDLDTPREPWYLKINPRGLVPTIKFSNGIIDEIITESGIVAQFLADSFPSHLLPASHESPQAPLVRARISFFVDAWFSKVQSKLMGALIAQDDEKEAKTAEAVATIEKEIEPLLKDAGPFFGGSEKMTMAEVLSAPFVLRLRAYSRAGLVHESALKKLEALPNFSKWADKVTSQESVTYIWDEDALMEKTKARMWKYRGEPKPTK